MMQPQDSAPSSTITLEQVAYWYLRLNGYLTLPNVLIHNRPGAEGTETDLLGVRFPFRAEMRRSGAPLADDELLCGGQGQKTDVVLAEVKTGRCAINPSWLRPMRANIERMLDFLGTHDEPCIVRIAEDLRGRGQFDDERYRIRFVMFGSRRAEGLAPLAVQLEHDHALDFIYERFRTHWRIKSQHRQWDEAGRVLYSHATACDSAAEFRKSIMALTCAPQEPLS